MTDFLDLARRRFSVRKFDGENVSREDLDKILEAARIAPSAKNLQPVRIYVLEGEDAIKKLDALTPCRYGAGTVLLFSYDRDEDWKNPNEEGVHSGVEDASIAATHAMMEAADLGVDSVWVNNFAPSAARKAYGLPESEVPVLLMPLGKRAEGARPTPNHTGKKPADEVVKYL